MINDNPSFQTKEMVRRNFVSNLIQINIEYDYHILQFINFKWKNK